MVPAAVMYVPPAVPAESEAVGVPVFMLRTANFAKLVVEEFVAWPPIARSSVELAGKMRPLPAFHTAVVAPLVQLPHEGALLPPFDVKQNPLVPVAVWPKTPLPFVYRTPSLVVKLLMVMVPAAAPLSGERVILPVVLPPMVRDWFWVVWMVPAAVM